MNVEWSTFISEVRKGGMDRIQEAGGGGVGAQEWLNLGDVVTLVSGVGGFLHQDYA